MFFKKLTQIKLEENGRHVLINKITSWRLTKLDDGYEFAIYLMGSEKGVWKRIYTNPKYSMLSSEKEVELFFKNVEILKNI